MKSFGAGEGKTKLECRTGAMGCERRERFEHSRDSPTLRVCSSCGWPCCVKSDASVVRDPTDPPQALYRPPPQPLYGTTPLQTHS